MKLSIERRPIIDLVAYVANSKNHGDEDILAIAASITRFGFNDPIAITPDGVIIEGHGRLMAADHLGLTDLPCLVIDGLTPRDYDLYRIAHNKIAMTSTFDFGRLFAELELIAGSDESIVFSDMGFSDKIIDNLSAHFGTGELSENQVGAGSRFIEYDVIWDNKTDKAVFTAFIDREVAAGAQKAMGGETFMAAVQRSCPELWSQVVLDHPEELSLDMMAGTVSLETVNVAS